MVYITDFTLHDIDTDVAYPYSVLHPLQLKRIEFEPITIFYGSNGSGKSTLLNILARKINIDMHNGGNDGEYLQQIIDRCDVDYDWHNKVAVPPGSRFIRSEDVMHMIVRIRQKNEAIKNHVKTTSPALYERFFLGRPDVSPGYVWNDDAWIFGALESFSNAQSNGELAYHYFENNIGMECMTLLDEPENSLSPKYQRNLADMITDYARFFKCQFVIATHSPFMLAIPGAKIYNLDMHPAKVCKWNELENMHIYMALFKRLMK